MIKKEGISNGVKKIKKVFYVFLVGVFFFSFFNVTQVSAQAMVQCDLTGDNACTLCDFFTTFDIWMDGLLTEILPVLAAVMIAVGGVFYLVSRGDPEKLATAKKIFASVAGGLLIAYSAWLIVNTFFLAVGISKWEGFDNGWWVINCPETAPSSSSSTSAPANGNPSGGSVPNPNASDPPVEEGGVFRGSGSTGEW